MLEEGRYLEADPHLRAGLEANRSAQDRRGIAQSLASMGELHYRLARLDEAERILQQAAAEAEQIQDATCLAYAGALLQRVQVLTAEPTGTVDAPALPVAADDLPAEVAALVDLAALEAHLHHDSGPRVLTECLRRATEAARAVTATDPNATVRNAAVEGLCAVLEASWAAGDVGPAGEAAQQLERHVGLAADVNLGQYARWLASVCRRGGRRHTAGLARLEGPHTVFAVRAQRLLEARDG